MIDIFAHGTQGGVRMVIFSLLGGANRINLYKNLIKIEICSANLGIMGARPLPPVSAPDGTMTKDTKCAYQSN